jgi:phage gp29-like protein
VAPLPKGAIEGQSFADELIEGARRLGVAALDPDLKAVMSDLHAAKDYDDLRARLVVRHADMDRNRLAVLVERTMLLAQLAGRLSAKRQPTKKAAPAPAP